MRLVPPPALLAFAALFMLATLGGCEAEGPPRGLEATCTKACDAKAYQCSPHECRRGCNLVMDRLAEDEGGHVLACIAANEKSCDDRAWAHCATLVGPHADGGPPPPPPPPDIIDVGGD